MNIPITQLIGKCPQQLTYRSSNDALSDVSLELLYETSSVRNRPKTAVTCDQPLSLCKTLQAPLIAFSNMRLPCVLGYLTMLSEDRGWVGHLTFSNSVRYLSLLEKYRTSELHHIHQSQVWRTSAYTQGNWIFTVVWLRLLGATKPEQTLCWILMHKLHGCCWFSRTLHPCPLVHSCASERRVDIGCLHEMHRDLWMSDQISPSCLTTLSLRSLLL